MATEKDVSPIRRTGRTPSIANPPSHAESGDWKTLVSSDSIAPRHTRKEGVLCLFPYPTVMRHGINLARGYCR